MPFQVASQQGVYLADCFNRMEKCEKDPEGPIRFRGEGRHRFRPFRYKFNLPVIYFVSFDDVLLRPYWHKFDFIFSNINKITSVLFIVV